MNNFKTKIFVSEHKITDWHILH